MKKKGHFHVHIKDDMQENPSYVEATDDIENLNSFLQMTPTLDHPEMEKHKKIGQGEPLSEELQHASEMSQKSDSVGTEEDGDVSEIGEKLSGFSSRRTTLTDSVRIDINDMGQNDSYNFTQSTLRKCKQLVLKPYWLLLLFIGWRGINKESVYSHRRRWKLLNIIYPSLVILFLVYSYMYEVLACEWKLNVVMDSKDVPAHKSTTTTPKTTTQHPNSSSVPWAELNPAMAKLQNATAMANDHNFGCEHIVTTYFIPNLLHLIAYIMGLYYFRIQENEQLYALMEKVFLQAAPVQARTASQQRMIKKLRYFLAFGILWVIITLLMQGLYVWAFDFPKLPLNEKIGTTAYWILLGFELLGRTVFNSIILAIVMNYCTQCEMIKFYVRGVAMRLQEKSTDLKTAMKDVLMLRQSLSLLNGPVSKMTSLVSVILAELTIIGICILALTETDDYRVWIYRSIFPLVWASMLSFPLFQAARVNSICLRLQKIAIEMRVFGYKGASILDLDSFLQFVTITKLKGKLFHITIRPSHLIFTLITVAFVLLILFQTSILAGRDNIF